ncbi:hypothetical protein DL769_008328 [Monosporascus sp. CRB-8-3]|nr:hypothetical protein DL769_008328 [Monosporascus sp. CRB-8-3]
MADPLSVAGSIAGLVTLTDAVFRGVYKYIKTASDAAGEVKELSNQLKSLAGVLHSLDILAGVLEDDAERATIQICHIRAGSRVLKEIQARIDKAASNLALQADSMNNLLKILNNQSDLKAELSAVCEGVKNLQALTRIELDVKRQQTLDFFLRINPQPNLDTSIRLRHPGTGEWLTESPGFREWLETAGSHMRLYESLRPSNGLPKEPDADNCRDLIEKMAENFDQVIIVVDGLDECGDNTDDVVGLLSDLAEYTANLSMALLSRDEYNINRRLQGSFTKVLVEAHKDDILLYVAAEIDKRIREGKLRIADMDLKDDIMNKLADKADRILTITQLRHAVSVPEAPNTTIDERAIVTEDEISLQCSSLIRKSEDGLHFEFSHFTVREFLERDTLLRNPEFTAYHVSESSSSTTMAIQCLRYLQLKNFRRSPTLDQDAESHYVIQRNGKYPIYLRIGEVIIRCKKIA